MHRNLLLGPALALAAALLLAPSALAQVGVESETSIVFNPQTNQMNAFTTATMDYQTSYWYDLCVDLAVGRLNGPYLVNATIMAPSGNPYCVPGAAQLDRSASVAATPGRQYFAVGLAELHVYYEYWIWVPVPGCGPYCEGYWYDYLGYSRLISTQPSSADSPSIVYTYPDLVPLPIAYQEIAMAGSADFAWAPPVIHSVSPNQWSAGTTTTFTISGAGFGYSPGLTISGSGIIAYTNPCASPNPSCDTQIVATVTIDANTPGGMVETITVTANGQNPSGFLPVPVQGPPGQATAQATTQAFVPPVPQIWFNGSNVTNNGSPSCPGNVACVVVGQKVELTVLIPGGITPTSHQWTQPTGTVVGGYIASAQTGQDVQIPNSSLPCQRLDQSCLTFYWVTPSATNSPWQVSYSYTYSNQTSQTVTARFNVTAPTGVQVTGSTGVPDVYNNSTYGATIGFVEVLNYGIQLTASATSPSGAPSGSFLWVQLLTAESEKIREGGPYSGTSAIACMPLFFAQDPRPVLDTQYPAATGPTFADAPRGLGIGSVYEGDVAGEVRLSMSFSTYLMWNPNLPGSIPVPLGSVAWQWACDAVNTLTPQSNGTNWIRACSAPQTQGSVQFSTSTTYPRWSNVALSPTQRSCQYQ